MMEALIHFRCSHITDLPAMVTIHGDLQLTMLACEMHEVNGDSRFEVGGFSMIHSSSLG